MKHFTGQNARSGKIEASNRIFKTKFSNVSFNFIERNLKFNGKTPIFDIIQMYLKYIEKFEL